MNDTTVNEAMMTANEVTANSLSKSSSKHLENQNKALQDMAEQSYPYS